MIAASILVNAACSSSQAITISPYAVWHKEPAAFFEQRLPVAGLDSATSTNTKYWYLSGEGSANAANTLVRVLNAQEDVPLLLPNQETERGALSTRASVAASYAGWESKLTYRRFYTATVSDGAVRLVRSYTAAEKLPEGTRLDFDAQIKHYDLAGVGIARSWPVNIGRGFGLVLVTVGTHLHRIRRFASLDATGSIHRSGDSYTFDGSAGLRDSSREFEGYGTPGVQGQSIGTDLGITWQPTLNSALVVSIVDAWSRTQIREVASQMATLRSDTRIVDNQGYLVSQPSVEGSYRAETLKTRLAPVYSIGAMQKIVVSANKAYPKGYFDDFSITTGLRLQSSDVVTLRSIWATASISNDCQLVVDYEFSFDSKGLGFICRWAQLMLRSNAGDLTRAKALGLTFSLTQRFAF